MNRPGSTHNGVVLFSSRISVVVADLMVVIFTLVRTFSHVREARRLRLKSSVSRCVIKDGVIYFIALCALNLIKILVSYSPGCSPINQLLYTLPEILVGRYLMNLRQAVSAGYETGFESTSLIFGCTSHVTIEQETRLSANLILGGVVEGGHGDFACSSYSV